ncbi:hypothetical protein [Ferrovibrio sp.]|uniref:hypothetical protein n=1 Tax=Ferrovibrio sp. TaxID=1917215 RepID=UPI00311EAFF6
MPDLILPGLAAYLAGAAGGFFLVTRSPLPAALFWGIGLALHAALAVTELSGRLGLPLFTGLEGDIRYHTHMLAPLSLALGAIFSLIIPAASRHLTLFAGIGLAFLIAGLLGRLPIGDWPLPLILLGILIVTILIGLRRRPVPGIWLLAATLAAGLAELVRHRYLGLLPVTPAGLADMLAGIALFCFGMTAYRTR